MTHCGGFMKIIFFGLGSIGLRHARLIKDNFDHGLFAYRTTKKQTNVLNIEEVYTIEDIKKIKPDIAFITNPTALHIQSIRYAASLNLHLFIEKPLCDILSRELYDILRLIKKKNLITYIACQLRFHPVIQYLKRIIDNKKIYVSRVICSSYLPDWRSDRDYRTIYSAKKSMGGGVLLDLIHEPDYCSWLFGKIKKVTGMYEKISNLDIETEDFANYLILHDSGVYSNIHLDYFGKKIQRIIEIIGDNFHVSGDLWNNTVTTVLPELQTVSFESLQKDEIYLNQLLYFFNCLQNNKQPMNSIHEHLNVLAPILNFKVYSSWKRY